MVTVSDWVSQASPGSHTVTATTHDAGGTGPAGANVYTPDESMDPPQVSSPRTDQLNRPLSGSVAAAPYVYGVSSVAPVPALDVITGGSLLAETVTVADWLSQASPASHTVSATTHDA